MAERVTRHSGSLVAEGDDGNRYTVHIFGESAPADGFEERGDMDGGGTILRTSDGFRVRRLDKGRYFIAYSGVTLTGRSS